jgi:hypothetical protein
MAQLPAANWAVAQNLLKAVAISFYLRLNRIHVQENTQ